MLRPIPLLCLGLIWLGVLGSAAPLWKRQTPATDGDFNIYAYGENISGLRLYNADGKKNTHSNTLSKHLQSSR